MAKVVSKPATKKDNLSSELGSFDIQFILAEHGVAVSERWNYVEKIWGAFRNYVALVSGSVGIILALIPFITDLYTLIRVACLAAIAVFIFGLFAFIQLLSLQRDLDNANKRLVLVRKQIRNFSSLSAYFNDLESGNIDLGFMKSGKRSIFELIKIGVKTAGLQTQIVILNCIIGTLGFLSVLYLMQVLQGIEIVFYGVLIFCFLLVLHLLYVYFRR